MENKKLKKMLIITFLINFFGSFGFCMEQRADSIPVLFSATTVQEAQSLINHGAQVSVTIDNKTLLDRVMEDSSYSPDLVTFYLEKGLDPNGENSFSSKLHFAPIQFLLRNVDHDKGQDSFEKAKRLFAWAKEHKKQIKTSKKYNNGPGILTDVIIDIHNDEENLKFAKDMYEKFDSHNSELFNFIKAEFEAMQTYDAFSSIDGLLNKYNNPEHRANLEGIKEFIVKAQAEEEIDEK